MIRGLLSLKILRGLTFLRKAALDERQNMRGAMRSSEGTDARKCQALVSSGPVDPFLTTRLFLDYFRILLLRFGERFAAAH